MSLFAKIAAQREADKAEGLHREIPMPGIEKVAETKPLPKPSFSFTKTTPNKVEATSPVASSTESSVVKPATGGFKFAIKPPAATAVVAPTTTALSTNVATVIPQASPEVPSGLDPNMRMADLNSLVIKDNTFDRGIEKYSPAEVEQLQGCLQLLRESFENPEIVGQNLKIVMQSMLANPNLKETIKPEDIGTMVRALRTSYGVHVVKSESRAGARKKSSADVEDAAAFLKTLGIG